jgi:uncharacterized membrane protein YgdD (TMEM256/DUF423 family)
MDRTLFIAGCISALVSVAAGAFGAHGLKDRISKDLLNVFEVAARYQMYHAFALIAAAWAYSQWHNNLSSWAGWSFIAGTILFSGSLYLMSFTGIKWLGAITPIGGLLFMVGWVMLAISAWKR